MLIPLFTGLAAGAAHVVAGPDHLAALAPIALDEPRQAGRLGFRWGLGHGVGVALLGGLGMVARSAVDVEFLSATSEFMVGFVLVLVGLWAFRSATRLVVHAHGHDHDGADSHENHSHFHVHTSGDNHDHATAHKGHSHAAFGVGLLHGAAGTGHLLGVLPSLAFPPVEAAIYLTAYFIAAVGAMAGFGRLLGAMVKDRGPVVLRRVMYGASTMAVCVGAFWIGQSWPL